MSRAAPRKRLTLRSIYAVPAVLTLLSLAGLIIALTGDGARDAIAWICLAAPVAAFLWMRRTRRS